MAEQTITADLRQRLLNRALDGRGHTVTSPAEVRAYADVAWRVYGQNRHEPELLAKAAFLRAYAEAAPVAIEADELIVGSQRFGLARDWLAGLTEQQREQMAFRGNLGHVIVDYGAVLAAGLEGLRSQIATQRKARPAAQETLDAFDAAVAALARFIARHEEAAEAALKGCQNPQRRRELTAIAACCGHIKRHRPRTFHEALQLVWFIQIWLHAEGGAAAVSFGRFDQYLWPWLQADLAARRLDQEQALKLLACFCIKCCEGDESQNLTLGGVNAAGAPAENPLSLWCLQAARAVRVWQPSLSVRIGPHTSEEFWAEALALCQAGFGQPGFFADDVGTQALQAAQLAPNDARDWGIVGCYEATGQGNTLGYTVASRWNLAEDMAAYLTEAAGAAPEDFRAFYVGYQDYLRRRHGENLRQFQQTAERLAANASPFESVCLAGCLDAAQAAEAGGAQYRLFGVNVLGLGTVIDSLWVVRRMVYETRRFSLPALAEQVAQDWPDEAMRQACWRLEGKYGTDTGPTNALAGDLSRLISTMILARKLNGGEQPYPGFFAFGADIRLNSPATPDGRRSGTPLSYGCGPTTAPRQTPTAVLGSALHIAHDRCANGNPLTVSLSRIDAAGPEGAERLRQLLGGYLERGGFHMHVNIVDAEQLRAAQAQPEAHAELMVKISGFSARFVTLERCWQDALIARAARGL